MVIAIDGPGGVGKTTVSVRTAAALGLPQLNTGAFYRAATLAALRSGAPFDDPDAVVAAVRSAGIGYEGDRTLIGDDDVSHEIRSPEVTAAVSPVSAMEAVRRLMVAEQRAWVERHGGRAVVEGRDIGTVVFPDAVLKIYLTARPEVRAARRAGDREAAGRDVAGIEADLATRDRYDASRAVSPMRPAEDAVIIDTSDLTIDQVVAEVVVLARRAAARLGATGGRRPKPV